MSLLLLFHGSSAGPTPVAHHQSYGRPIGFVFDVPWFHDDLSDDERRRLLMQIVEYFD